MTTTFSPAILWIALGLYFALDGWKYETFTNHLTFYTGSIFSTIYGDSFLAI